MKRHFDPVTLRLFVAVCEERNIARAAEREAIVPSAISKRVAQIEGEVGVPLLKRGRRGIEPTPAGEVLLRQARDLLSTMERMHAELSEFAAGVSGSVRVFASLSVLSEYLPDDVGAFLAKHRKVRVSLEERVSSDIARGVREGAADFGVLWDAGDLSGLTTHPYRIDHLCIVLLPGHPLAGKKKVAFIDTLPYEQIEIQSGSMVQGTLRRAAAMANQTLRHRILVSTFNAACRNVAAGLGIAVVPREVAETYARARKLRLIALTDSWAERRFVICMRARESLTATARLLVDYLHARAGGAT
ncbi:MAG TPA: LysR family transcriptional regulator [Burkholderiaceae bacterium]|nr:LysR family transcriptional regulator [Burkholderiaceae bacterium]